MNLKGRHLIDPSDFSLEELKQIFDLADKMIDNRDAYGKICDGKILGTLFYEPSTRTRLKKIILNFQTPMKSAGQQKL